MQAKYYTYTLTDPRTLIPFYAGKGSGKRAYRHSKLYISDDCKNPRKNALIRSIQEDGMEPIVTLVETGLVEHVALQSEYDLIKQLGRKHIDFNGVLLNILPGGESTPNNYGKPRSEETKRKISETRIAKGLHPSVQCYDAARKSNKGKAPWNKGKAFLTDEQRVERQKVRCNNIRLFNEGSYNELLAQDLTPKTRRNWMNKINRTEDIRP
jgi:hypothetical protein